MSAYDVIVIGGGPAGHSAAAGYREAGGRGTVLLLAGEAHAPYERPPLSKDLLRGESEPDALPMEDPGFYREQGIEVRHAEALALDAGRPRRHARRRRVAGLRALRPRHRRAADPPADPRRRRARRAPAAHASTHALALRAAAVAGHARARRRLGVHRLRGGRVAGAAAAAR